MACTSPGNCTAAGQFTGKSGPREAFVVSQTRGRWGKAQELPGIGALNKGHSAIVSSLSCGAPGDCTVAGWYTAPSIGDLHAFLADEHDGRWGKARQAPGTGALNTGLSAAVASVSCTTADSCSAVGSYRDRSGHHHPFLLSKVRGTWGTAMQVPGISALDTGPVSALTTVSCASAGDCAAGGSYSSSAGRESRAFVVEEKGGRWGKARQVPGSAGLLADQAVISVACASAGNCSAGGTYDDGQAIQQQAFVVSEVRGTWGKATPVPGLVAINRGEDATIDAVSCGAPGDCSAGGSYESQLPPPNHGLGNFQAWVVSEKNGHWGKAIQVPGSKALNTGKTGSVEALSCAGKGSCGATGLYQTARNNGFLASEAHGTWGRALKVSGLAALKASDVMLGAITCVSPGNCLATGSYGTVTSRHALIVSQKNGVWGKATGIPGL